MRRIQRDIAHEGLVKDFTSGDRPVFREIWRLMLFSAAIGVHEGRRREVDKVDSGKAIPDTYFSAPGWKGLLYLMAISENEDTSCLYGTEEAQERLAVSFEEYANYGMQFLSDRHTEGSDPLDEILLLLFEMIEEKNSAIVLDDLL